MLLEKLARLDLGLSSTLCPIKIPVYYLLKYSVKNKLILIIFGSQN